MSCARRKKVRLAIGEYYEGIVVMLKFSGAWRFDSPGAVLSGVVNDVTCLIGQDGHAGRAAAKRALTFQVAQRG